MATAKFSGYSFRADIEGAYKHQLNNFFTFRPFAGLDAVMRGYEDFEESGADSVNVAVKGANNFSANIRLGAGIVANLLRLTLNADAEYNYVLSGADTELKGRLAASDRDFTIKSTDLGKHAVAIKGGANLRVTNNISIFGNASYRIASDFTESHFNAGIKYAFCTSCRSMRDREYNEPIDFYVPELDNKPQEPATESADEKAETEKTEQAEEDKKITISDSFFYEDSSAPNPALDGYIKEVSNDIKAKEYTTVTVTGYSDDSGKAEDDENLSVTRALMVADRLVKEGIDSSKITIEGKGSANPIADNASDFGKSLNRRVEIKVD